DPVQFQGDGNRVTRVPSGPNRGYSYVDTATYNMKRVGNVDPAILPTSLRLHQLSGKTGKNCAPGLGFGSKDTVRANFNRFNAVCQGINMTVYVDAAYGHEGFGYAGGKGHESLARAAAAEPKNDPYAAIERLVFVDSTALKAEAD